MQRQHDILAKQKVSPTHDSLGTQTVSPTHDSLGTQTVSPMHDNLATQTSLNSEHQSHYGAEGEQHQTFTMMGRDDTPVKHSEIEPYESEEEIQHTPHAPYNPFHDLNLTTSISPVAPPPNEPVAPHPDEPGTSQSHYSSKITPVEAASMSKKVKKQMATQEQQLKEMLEKDYERSLKEHESSSYRRITRSMTRQESEGKK